MRIPVFQRFHSRSLTFLTSRLARSIASSSMLSGTMKRGLAVAHFFMFIFTIFLPPSHDIKAFRKGSAPVNTFGCKSNASLKRNVVKVSYLNKLDTVTVVAEDGGKGHFPNLVQLVLRERGWWDVVLIPERKLRCDTIENACVKDTSICPLACSSTSASQEGIRRLDPRRLLCWGSPPGRR